jgi:hypothetical protein
MARARGKEYKSHKLAIGKRVLIFSGEVCAGRSGLKSCFVIEQDLTLPIVRLDAQEAIGKEQDGDFGSGSFAVCA